MPKESRATRRDHDKAHDIVLAIDLKGFLRTFCGLKSLGFRVCLREEVFTTCVTLIIRQLFLSLKILATTMGGGGGRWSGKLEQVLRDDSRDGV